MLATEQVVEKSIVEQMLDLVDLEKLEYTLRRLSPENLDNVDLSWHIKQWAREKKHMFKLLGNKLKVEREVDTALPPSTVSELTRQFMRENINNKKEYCLVEYFFNSIENSDIVNNSLSCTSFEMFNETFKRGAKISRIIAKLVHKDFVHELQTKYSMFLQKLKAKGKAVISIDPIDYLTMSVNNSGWRSCHALDGEFRAGTLAYMVDSSTMISYVKTSEDINHGEKYVPYSNKIWRQIVLVDSNTSLAIQARQYPGEVVANANTITDMLKSMLKQVNNRDYQDLVRSPEGLFPFIENYNCTGETLWYNDILSESFSRGIIIFEKDVDFDWLSDYYDDNGACITVGSDVKAVDNNHYWLEDSGCISTNCGCDDEEDDWDDDYDNDDDNDNREW